MNCPKCGAPLPDGAKFCGSCGCKVGEPVPSDQTIVARKPTMPVAQPVEEPTPVQPDRGAAAAKKSRLPLLIVGVVAVVALLAVLFFAVLPKLGGSGKNAYAVLQDGHFELLKDLKKGDMIEIANARSDDDSSVAWFSKDGKYFYFFTKFDSNSYTGTLCRAEYGKLKANSSKNDQYILTIASNVQSGVQEVKDGGLLYQNADGTLYYFDGKESTQLAKNVENVYNIPDSDSQFLYTRNKDGDENDLDLYYLSLDKPEDPAKIDSHISAVMLYQDLNNIVYLKTGDNGEDNLYTAGISKDPEKVAVDTVYAYADDDNNRYFYRKSNGKTLSAYDFVNDPYKVTEEPDYWDFDDYDDYSTAWRHYNARSIMMESDYDIELYDLYCLKDGETTLIAEDIISTDSANGGFLYWDKDAFANGIDIDDLENTSDVTSAVTWLGGKASQMMDVTKFMVYNAATDQSYPLSGTDDEDLADLIGDSYLYIMEDGVVLRSWSNDSLLKASIENGALSRFSTLADDAQAYSVRDGVLYYTAERYDRDGKTYGDLYTYSKGQSNRVAQDILMSQVLSYEDGKLYVYTDTNSDGYELTCVEKDGTKNVIAEDVSDYLRVDKSTLLYVSDNDLYCYDGKEKTRVATDISGVWSASRLLPDNYFWLY